MTHSHSHRPHFSSPSTPSETSIIRLSRHSMHDDDDDVAHRASDVGGDDERVALARSRSTRFALDASGSRASARALERAPVALALCAAVVLAIGVLFKAIERGRERDDQRFVAERRRCHRCAKRGARTRCERCKRAWYCGPKCRADAWKMEICECC